MNSAAARAYYASLTGAARTTPCTHCGAAAVPFTSLCRFCYRERRPHVCQGCGGPLTDHDGQTCGACRHRRQREQHREGA